jgi:predicted short-subunit dehydrogenase-like oxidoreductase (DUF2520 family)
MQSIKKVVLIGSGNVATQLANVFVEKGIEILQVYSPNLNHAKNLASVLRCEPIDDLDHIDQEADLYLIAVKDDAITAINDKLRLHGKIAVHTSGSAGLSEISSISNKTGVFYPLQTFTKNRAINWQKIPICLEASDPDTGELLHEFAERISNTVFDIDSHSRRQLHLAAVFANNFTNYLLGQAKDIISNKLPFTILEPLIQETIDKAFDMGPDAAQTGPALRGDTHTIEAHLKLLENDPETMNLYRILTDFIARKHGRENA